MKIATFLTLIAIGLVPHTGALAASFDCSKARTSVEKLICSDPLLSELDSRMAQEYRRELQTSLHTGILKDTQRQWLKRRNACSSPECIEAAYRLRIEDLGGDTAVTAEQLNVRTKRMRGTAQTSSASPMSGSKTYSYRGLETGLPLSEAEIILDQTYDWVKPYQTFFPNAVKGFSASNHAANVGAGCFRYRPEKQLNCQVVGVFAIQAVREAESPHVFLVKVTETFDSVVGEDVLRARLFERYGTPWFEHDPRGTAKEAQRARSPVYSGPSPNYLMWGGSAARSPNSPERYGSAYVQFIDSGSLKDPLWPQVDGKNIKVKYWRNDDGVTGYELLISDLDWLLKHKAIVDADKKQESRIKQIQSERELRF